MIPRLQSGKWDGKSQVQLEYNSLSDVAPNAFAIAKLYASKPAKKWDIFTSLRGWQLKSSVQISGTKGKDGPVAVTFVHWTASGEDLYDFDKNEHLTLPNPDYLSKATYAIEPQKKELTVYHKNAFRLENARPPLAKPFKVRIRPWIVRDQAVLAPATIDPKKDLS